MRWLKRASGRALNLPRDLGKPVPVKRPEQCENPTNTVTRNQGV